MSLDAEAIRHQLGDAVMKLESLEVFAEIESTNSYLMQRPGPKEGFASVAATDNQTAGRGRLGRRWLSPPGSGLCLSLAYTFAVKPENLSAMTLAVGLGVAQALKKHRVEGVQLKWPNDLVAGDCKLGGILAEARSEPGGAVTVVTGIGLNVDLSQCAQRSVKPDWAQRAIDLRSYAGIEPDKNALTSSLVSGLVRLLQDYEAGGFGPFRERWRRHDWLRGKAVAISTPQREVSGVSVGIADDGALLLKTAGGDTQRITSGSVMLAERAELSE